MLLLLGAVPTQYGMRTIITMHYQHRWLNNEGLRYPTGKVVCVGRNYVDHIHELNNVVPSEPVIFIKPSSALCCLDFGVVLPKEQGAVHHEVEVALLIGSTISKATKIEASQAIIGVGIALDLTLRDVQSELKNKSLPWEMAKAFDNSCPITPFTPIQRIEDLQNIHFSLKVNDTLRQQGCSAYMLMPAVELVQYMSRYFTLMPGDIVLTGTPSGVAALHHGDMVTVTLNEQICVTAQCY